jgi:hypothetical protein
MSHIICLLGCNRCSSPPRLGVLVSSLAEHYDR